MRHGVKRLVFPLPAHRSVVACVPLKGDACPRERPAVLSWKSIFASARGAPVVAFSRQPQGSAPPRRAGRPWWHFRARSRAVPRPGARGARGGIFAPPRRAGRPWWHFFPAPGQCPAPARGAPQDVATQFLHSVKHAAQSCTHLVNGYTEAGRKKKRPPLLACARFLDAVFTRFASQGNHVCALARAML